MPPMAGPKYSNQQLRAVSLEAYFRGRLGFRDGAARVQRKLEKELPHLYVPNAKPEVALDLQPYQLRNENSTESLAMAVNQVAYASFDYPGHESFLRRALTLMSTALAEIEVSNLERVINRYENEIALARDDKDIVPVHKVLRLPADRWWQPDSLTELTWSWTQHARRGQLAIRVAVEGEARVAEKLLISIVSVVMPAGPVTDLRRFAGEAHEAARAWFESAITDEFREYIEGEPDE